MKPSKTSPHLDFIKGTLPAWFVYTTQPLREALRKELVRGQYLRTQVGKALANIKGLDAFARPLLREALDKEFGPGLDMDRDHFSYVQFEKTLLPLPARLVGRETSVYSLLEAALHNFHEEEVAAVKAESVIFYGRPDIPSLVSGRSYPHPLQVSPARFMALCRRLDIGGQYQAHLRQVLDVQAGRAFQELLGYQALNALHAATRIAYLRQHISSGVQDALLALSTQTRSSAQHVTCRSVRLLDVGLRDILVFQLAGRTSYTVYMPGQTDTPLKEYPSLDAFVTELRDRLRAADYQRRFSRYIAQRNKAVFAARLEDCLTPKRKHIMPGDEDRLIPRYYLQRDADPDAELQLELEDLAYPLGEQFHFQAMLRIKDDARALAVPTGDEDQESRRARLAGYVSLGMNVVNLAAFFIPVLGEMMMVVAAAQLLDETFEGIGAWLHGDLHEAMEHLCSVAENIAFMAAMGAAGKFAEPVDIPPVNDSTLIGKMIPVKLANGQTRLWLPDLAPFATEVVLPEGLQPDTEGVFIHQDKHYITLDGRMYRVEHDPALNEWRVKPDGTQRFSPRLEHNGAGAWRHEGEDPATWSRPTAFRRLGHRAAWLSEQAADQVMQVTGSDESLLSVLHLDNQAPPAGLADTLERFDLDRQVSTFVDLINDGTRFESADVRLQLELLPSIRGWPRERVIQVLDAQADALAQQGIEVQPVGRPILVSQAQLDQGQLLSVVLDALSEGEQAAIFSPRRPASTMNLAFEIGRLTWDRLPQLFDSLNQAREAGAEPLVRLLQRDFPGLPAAAAREVLAEADAQQRASMAQTQRIPLAINGRVRLFLQEARLNQALEGFFLASRANNSDTLKLSLHLLERLPGWPKGVRLEVRDRLFNGPLLDAIGEPLATRRAILVKRGDRFLAFDTQGAELQEDFGARDNFFSAVLHALPAESRQAIGFADAGQDSAALGQWIAEQATSQRQRSALILGMQQPRPRFRGPTRLADGRFGYVLSGRGRPIPDLPAGTEHLAALYTELYSESPGASVFLGHLLQSGITPEQLLEDTRFRLRGLDLLRASLDGWVNPTQAGPSITQQQFEVRQAVADAIIRAWRYSGAHAPTAAAGTTGLHVLLLDNLDLTGFTLPPDLVGHYASIHAITLNAVTASAEVAGRFLRLFPGVRTLNLSNSGLTELPVGLRSLRRLGYLSLEQQGMTIDQAMMDQLMQLPALSTLDLSGNTFGEISGVAHDRLQTLWLNHTGLTQWPQWTESLGLRLLDISHNAIEHLPEHVLQNGTGAPYQMEIYAYGNPLDEQELQRFHRNDRGYGMTYRLEFDRPDMELDSTDVDSDESTDSTELGWHSHSRDRSLSGPPVPEVDIWLVAGREALNNRLRQAWAGIEAAGDAPNLLILMQRLKEAPDFERFHEELANDVLTVLETAVTDTTLRGQLEAMANDRLFGADQTCQDGARLIFSDIQVAVYVHRTLQAIPGQGQGETLLQVLRSLFRLNRVQAIADLDIAGRESLGARVDHAEVRMVYRIRLAADLHLPGQPLSMAWERLAAVDLRSVLAARRQVLLEEQGPEFIDYAIADPRWSEYLRNARQADFERVVVPFETQMSALLDHPPVDMVEELRQRSIIYERLSAAHAANDMTGLERATRDLEALAAHPPVDADENARQSHALMVAREAAQKALLEQLTESMRDLWM